jgi:hypothetical protein
MDKYPLEIVEIEKKEVEMAVEMEKEYLSKHVGDNDLGGLFPTFEDGEQGSNQIEFPKSPKEPQGNLLNLSNKSWQDLKDLISTQICKLKSKGVSLATFEKNTSSALFEMSCRVERGEAVSKNDLLIMSNKIESALEGLRNAQSK